VVPHIVPIMARVETQQFMTVKQHVSSVTCCTLVREGAAGVAGPMLALRSLSSTARLSALCRANEASRKAQLVGHAFDAGLGHVSNTRCRASGGSPFPQC